MSSRAEKIAVEYLEREVKLLKRKITRLESVLKAKDSELQSLKETSAKVARSRRDDSRQTEEVGKLRRQLEMVQAARREDADVLDTQRDLIVDLQARARKKLPKGIFEAALATSKLSPMAIVAIERILGTSEPFEMQVVRVLEAYDVMWRAARKAVADTPGNDQSCV